MNYPKHRPFGVLCRFVNFNGNFLGAPFHSKTTVFCFHGYCEPALIAPTMAALLVTVVTINDKLL